jgi:hypothetical protein
MLDDSCESLDDILCDPDSVAKFDSLAELLAPGFPRLMYRWGALKLRKESKRARSRSGLLEIGKFSRPQSISARGLSHIPTKSGVYLVRDQAANKSLYAGEALNLRSRLTQQFDSQGMKTWKKRWGSPLTVSFFTAESEALLLLAYQSLCVRLHHPRLNLPELALT